VTLRVNVFSVVLMIELIRITDPVSIQILSDALESRHIHFRIDNTGMNALMPLPTVMDARVLVADEDRLAAELIVADLELNV